MAVAIYADRKFDISSEDTKYDSKQIVMNNNAGDIHPIDAQRKDKDGHPVVIGKPPLTASPKAREAELREYVATKHLLPVIRNINAEKMLVCQKLLQTPKVMMVSN